MLRLHSQMDAFDNNFIRAISTEITTRTLSLDFMHRKIIVPDNKIIPVLRFVSENYRPDVADMGTSKNPLAYNKKQNYYDEIFNEVVDIIVKDIETSLRNEYVQDHVYTHTNKLSLPPGTAPISGIKLKHKRPTPMMFNMKY